ncbi:hypothetical protein [Dickeya oryzae]
MSATYYYIQNKLLSVFSDFKGEEWCGLNLSNFSLNGYAIKAHQQAYMLKYYSAYFCELYDAYKHFLSQYSGRRVNVLSIGCGSGVDCEALNRINIDSGRFLDIKYIGVDAVDWDYRPVFNWASYQHKSADDIDDADVCDIDLFVFPKSLTELDESTRVHIAETIIKNSHKDKVYFLNTYVTNRPPLFNYIDGINQFKTINDQLVKNSWCSLSDPSEYWYLKDLGWLRYSFDFFSIPNEVAPFVGNLKENCGSQDDSDKCRECHVGFHPIFNGNYLAYGVVGYEKRAI